ncbi:sugar nucleotide-binding protein, partial [Gemmatimonas sp.]|uniref:sugar nucleotide-binding protein n=1 Tax=Gemmatimonas sp. TaxID=1962908 RepID=UPI00356641EA
MKELLVFGGAGQVGRAITAAAGSDWRISSPSSTTVNLRDPGAAGRHILDVRPHAIINVAAYTRVDDAESDRDG